MRNEYQVKDLYEAAYLYSIKKTLIKLERESNYFWFVFEDTLACEKKANEYWSGTAVGNIKAYADALKRLKERLFAQK